MYSWSFKGWPMRTFAVNICSDIAEGMAYLHHHSPVRVELGVHFLVSVLV
jgi:hypothetical protein